MDPQPPTSEPVAPAPAGFDPNHFWARPESRIDLTAVKPHKCMQNIRQIGNYVHCYDGNHGVRLKPNQMLVKEGDNFIIKDIEVHQSPVLPVKRKRGKL